MQIADSLKSTLGSASEPQNHEELLSYRGIIMFYAWIGDVDKTLDWLERGSSWSHEAIPPELMNSEVFDRVREDSSFRSGVERIHAQVRERLLEAVAG